MALGRFGGSAPPALRVPSGGAPSSGDLVNTPLDLLQNSPYGMAATTSQMYLPGANYGFNLIKNGSFEFWNGASASDPPNWDGGGGGQSVAKDTTAANVRDGSTSFDLTNAAGATAAQTQTLTISATVNPKWRGAYITMSAWVKASTASRVFIRLGDGLGTSDSDFHSGSGAFELLTVTRLLDVAATSLAVGLRIATGGAITATFDSVMVVFGQTPVSFSPHINDLALLIDNYQAETTNNIDYGPLRCETGSRSSSASAGVTITFRASFSAIFAFVATVANNENKVFVTADTVTTSNITGFGTFDNTNTRVGGVVCKWVVIGS